MNDDVKTELRSDGLRYVSKPNGSPFAPATSGAYSSMSCFYCGRHRGATQRGMKRILGKTHAVCAPSCKSP